MKLPRLAAVLTAAVLAFVPFAPEELNAVGPQEARAETGIADPSMNDWIPTSFEEALEFRNEYGETMCAGSVACVVFRETDQQPADDGTQPRYKVLTTDGVMKEGYRATFTSDTKSEYVYEVIAYEAVEPGDFDIALVDTWLKSYALDLGYYHAVSSYSFHADDDLYVTQTDVYGWLPDCVTEFKQYTDAHGECSVHDESIVYCVTEGIGTAYGWQTSFDRGEVELTNISYCSYETAIPLAGGTSYIVYVFKPLKDGIVNIELQYGELYSGADPVKTYSDKFVVMNGGETVLGKGMIMVSFVDYDTGDLIPFIEGEQVMLATNIGYRTDAVEGGWVYTGPVLAMDKNPEVMDELASFSDADLFEFRPIEYDLPAGYTFPAGSTQGDMTYKGGSKTQSDAVFVKYYDNGAIEVSFRLEYADKGDANGDGSFNIADAVTLQKWLTGEDSSAVKNWMAADLCRDGRLDIFDLCEMRTMLAHYTVDIPVLID